MAIITFGKDRVLLEKAQESLEQIAQAVTQTNPQESLMLIAEAVEQTNAQAMQQPLISSGVALKHPQFSDAEKLNAAYALNLCTVSVSQIIDYNDMGILEQEYEAILNNLNIEHMPKDEALLDILKHLLDTITFFRIQEGDKAMLEREYQHNVKNAIWSAVPNVSVVMGGSLLAVAASVVMQAGIGYMNYRKQKASLLLSKEKADWQLQRSAMEQLNGLRRELFETAWRLADTYQFPDEYRLTERQITQYNQIILDSDPLRRYERLRYVEKHFKAYPPFHYYLGHAAYEVSETTAYSSEMRSSFRIKAKGHHEQLLNLTQQNILREDQILAACALEYFELYVQDRTLSQNDKAMMGALLQRASTSAGNANDVLQLCAMSYMRIGLWTEAMDLLRMLVNEGYNQIVNAQFLSSYYVAGYLQTTNPEMKDAYQSLSSRVSSSALLPMPIQELPRSERERMELLENTRKVFMLSQKNILMQKYTSVIATLADRYTLAYNKILFSTIFVENPATFCFTDTPEGFHVQQDALTRCNREIQPIFTKEKGTVIAKDLLGVINQCCETLYCLPCMTKLVQSEIHASILEKICNSDEYDDPCAMQMLISQDTYADGFAGLYFDEITEVGFLHLLKAVSNAIEGCQSMESISCLESELLQFCNDHHIASSQSEINYTSPVPSHNPYTISLESLGSIAKDLVRRNKTYNEMAQAISLETSLLKPKSKFIKLHHCGDQEFDDYFKRNRKDLSPYEKDTLFIINDTSLIDNDWLVTVNGLHAYCRIKADLMLEAVTSPTMFIPLLSTAKLTTAALTKTVEPLIPYDSIQFSTRSVLLYNNQSLGLEALDLNQERLWNLIQEFIKIHHANFPEEAIGMEKKEKISMSSRLLQQGDTLLETRKKVVYALETHLKNQKN